MPVQIKKTKVLKNTKPKTTTKPKPKPKPKVKKENNFLYKFSFSGKEAENVKFFINQFKSFSEATSFIDNLISIAIENYPLVKTIYYNQTINDKYEDDDTIDDITENFTPLFDETKFKTLNNINDLCDVFSKSNKRISALYLNRYKTMIAKDENYFAKLNSFIEILKDGNFYIIQNKENVKEISVDEPKFFERIININELHTEKFGKAKPIIHAILDLFGDVKRTKKTTSANELNFINKMVMLKHGNQKIIIEESRKKNIVENKQNKFSYNFIAFKTDKKLKKKSLQIFEMLNDDSKIRLINCLKN